MTLAADLELDLLALSSLLDTGSYKKILVSRRFLTSNLNSEFVVGAMTFGFAIEAVSRSYVVYFELGDSNIQEASLRLQISRNYFTNPSAFKSENFSFAHSSDAASLSQEFAPFGISAVLPFPFLRIAFLFPP